MTYELDISQLLQVAENALNAQKGKEFMLGDVYRQTRAAYERFPEDTVIRQVAFTIEKMADKAPEGATISQEQIAGIYNDLVRLSSSSKFRDVLGHLLPHDRVEFSSKNSDYVNMSRVDAEPSGISTDDMVDQNLVGALQSAFDGSMSQLKAYDEKKAKAGKEYVRLELESLGYKNPNVETLGGNHQTLVYAAHIDTRNGRVSVAIPIHLAEDGRLLLPSTFVADDHLEPLAGNNLQYFVDKKGEARDFNIPKVSEVLEAVGIISGKREASENEFTDLAKLFGEGDAPVSLNTPNLFVDRKYEEPRTDIDTTPDVQMPKELAHLAKDFEDDVLEAVSAFGKHAVDTGKRMVLSELKAAGFKAQVRFGSESGNSVVYLATIPTSKGPVDIEVPVEMVATASDTFAPLFPKVFAYDGTVTDFIPSKLQRFAAELPAPSTNSKIYQTAFAYMTLPELKEQLLTAVADQDYNGAEAILTQIGERYSEEDHKNAIADYNHMLMQKTSLNKQADQAQHTCNKVIPAGKGSVYARCGHFGVPLQQVVADAQGNCQMKSSVERNKLNPLEEGGAGISTSKLLLT